MNYVYQYSILNFHFPYQFLLFHDLLQDKENFDYHQLP